MLQVKEPSFVTVGGRRLAYDEVSPVQPRGTILLLTGLASKRLAWINQLEEFGRYYRTIAIDHRDVGDSDEASGPYTTADQAEDAAALLKALGIAKTNVVGISMGGFISLELTLRHPEMVEKLVLVSTSAGGPTHVNPGPQILALLMRSGVPQDPGELARQTYSQIMYHDFVKSHPETMDLIADIGRYRPQSAAAYGRQLQSCLAHDASSRLGQISIPTLVIHGEEDPLVPFPNGLNLSEKIPGAKLIRYPQTGHIPIMERAEQFNRDVLSFLDS